MTRVGCRILAASFLAVVLLAPVSCGGKHGLTWTKTQTVVDQSRYIVAATLTGFVEQVNATTRTFDSMYDTGIISEDEYRGFVRWRVMYQDKIEPIYQAYLHGVELSQNLLGVVDLLRVQFHDFLIVTARTEVTP